MPSDYERDYEGPTRTQRVKEKSVSFGDAVGGFLFGEPANPNSGIEQGLDFVRPDRYRGLEAPSGEDLTFTGVEKSDMAYRQGRDLTGPDMGQVSPFQGIGERADPYGREAMTQSLSAADKLARGELPDDDSYRRHLMETRALNTANALGAVNAMGRGGQGTAGAELMARREAGQQQAGADNTAALYREAQRQAAMDAGARAQGTIGYGMRDIDFGEAEAEAAGQNDWSTFLGDEGLRTAADNWSRGNTTNDNNARQAGEIGQQRVAGDQAEFDLNQSLGNQIWGANKFRAGLQSRGVAPGTPGILQPAKDLLGGVADVIPLFGGGGDK